MTAGWVAVAPPDFFKHAINRDGIETVAVAITSAEDHHLLIIHFTAGGARPVAFEDAGTDAGFFFTEQFAGFFIEADEGGGVWVGDVFLSPVDAIGSGDVEAVADDED